MRLPTADEIDIHGSLDEIDARKHFLGKTVEQAEALFRENSNYYLEDLMWMGPKAFCFYIPAAIRYLQSREAERDCDAVNAFYGTLEFWLHDERDEIAACLPDLRIGVRYILDHWERFEIDPAIYGRLDEKYAALLRTMDT